MSLFDIKIPYDLCTDDPLVVPDKMSEFAEYIRELYGKKINEGLEKSKRYESFILKFGKRYKEYLQKSGLPESLVFSGSIVKDSLVKKSRRGYVILELCTTVKIPGTTKSVESYVRAMEYGTMNFPALNVVRKANRDVVENLRRYYHEYLRTNSVPTKFSNRGIRQSRSIVSGRNNR